MANASIFAAFERMWHHTIIALSGKADSQHKHNVSDLTDLDVATTSKNGLLSAADKIKLNDGGNEIVTTAGTGEAFTATVAGVTALKVGMKITIIPHVASTIVNATLNVNGLGAKIIRQRLSTNTSITVAATAEGWLVKGKPVTVMYNGTYWVAELTRADANNIYGTIPIASGGTGATDAATALANLGLTATATELNYMDGVTSNVQTQLNGKAASSHAHNILTLAGTNVAWNGTDWNGGTRQYYYEGANVTDLNLPHPHVVVIVSKQGVGRGVALAYAWNSGFQCRTWINCLHDSWSGWEETTSTRKGLATSSSVLLGTSSSGFNMTIDAKYHSLYLTGSVGSSETMNLMIDMRYPRAGHSVSQSMAHGNSSITFTVSGNTLTSSGSSNGVSVYGLYYS